MNKATNILPLTTTFIPAFWRVGYRSGGYSNIFAATQGSWQHLFWRFYWLGSKHSYQHFQKMAKMAFTDRDKFARIAQQQADMNYLCAEYMKRRGLPPAAFKGWLGTKEAKKLMLEAVEKRKRNGVKSDER